MRKPIHFPVTKQRDCHKVTMFLQSLSCNATHQPLVQLILIELGTFKTFELTAFILGKLTTLNIDDDQDRSSIRKVIDNVLILDFLKTANEFWLDWHGREKYETSSPIWQRFEQLKSEFKGPQKTTIHNS